MQKKKIALDRIHSHTSSETDPQLFNYGPIGCLPKFEGTHPEVMTDWIKQFNWGNELNYGCVYRLNRLPMKHEKLKYRVLRWFEKTFNNGIHLFPFTNWNILKP